MPRYSPGLFIAAGIASLASVALAAAAISGCLPTYTFGDVAPNDAGGGAGNDATTTPPSDAGVMVGDAGGPGADANPLPGSEAGSPPADGSVVTPPTLDASTDIFEIASAGNKIASTGYGEELHFFYAQNDHRYWLFYADDTAGTIETRASTDQVTWTPGSLPLSPFSLTDGYDFSLAYANIAGNDVVHLVANAKSSGTPGLATLHVRATISGGTLHVTNTATVPDTTDNGAAGSGGGSCPQDGPSTAIAADGHVFDVTAWTGHPGKGTTCDTNIYRSTGLDTGTTWTPTFDHDGYYVSVPEFAFSHELLTLPDAGLVLAVWPDEDNAGETLFDSMGWALSSAFPFDAGAIGTDGIVPTASAELFNGLGGTNSIDEWALCRLSDTDVHAVRHVTPSGGSTPSTFQELRFNGSAWQTASPAPPTAPSASNTGVVLLGDGTASHGMLLVTIDALNQALDIAKWTASAGWTTLAPLPATAVRQSLAGSGCGSTPPHVFWTEGTGPYAVKGADLSSLLAP